MQDLFLKCYIIRVEPLVKALHLTTTKKRKKRKRNATKEQIDKVQKTVVKNTLYLCK